MPKVATEKCRLCAKLSIEDAIARHGQGENGCWDGDKCHKRRTYYRNRDRYNKAKRESYRKATGTEPVKLTVKPPAIAFGVLILYRARVDAPLHALGAELWQGKQKVADIETVHTLGWKPGQVQGYLRDVLQAFSEQAGVKLDKFEMQQERSPGLCPLAECLLGGS